MKRILFFLLVLFSTQILFSKDQQAKVSDKGNSKKQEYIDLYNQAAKKQDGKEAITWLEKLAEMGDPYYVYLLAVYRSVGLYGSDRNIKEAYSLYEKAAKMGQEGAQAEIARYFYHPTEEQETALGIKQDCKKALSWYQKAAKTGYDGAFHLGTFYEDGCNGKYVDFKNAIRSYRRGLKSGGYGELAKGRIEVLEQKISEKKHGKKNVLVTSSVSGKSNSSATTVSKAEVTYIDVLKVLNGAEFRPVADTNSNYADMWVSVTGNVLTFHDYDPEEEKETTEVVNLAGFGFHLENYAVCTTPVPKVGVPQRCPAAGSLARDGKTITIYPRRVQWDHAKGKGVFFKNFINDTVEFARTK